MCRIQYIRHLHDKVSVLETRTAPPKEEDTHAADQAAALYGGVGLMLTDGPLMIQNGPGYGGGGYGGGPGYGSSSIPDPYQQQVQGYGGGGYGAAPTYGAPAYGGGGYY